MNIALIGYGKMGKSIHKLAKENGAEVTLIVDPTAPEANAKSIDDTDFTDIDVAIDFTHPETAIQNVQKLADKKVNIVMGTTGWYDDEGKMREIVENTGIGFLWASNFSIGVHLFWEMVQNAGKIMNKQPQYNISGHEWHHIHKKDAPSGTAVSTAKILIDEVDRLHTLEFGSTREGEIPGTHIVTFESPVDKIEIKHEAKGREGFALGSVECAKWLAGKTGFYSIEDYLNS